MHGKRPVHAVCDGSPHAQLSDREHGENVCERAVQTEILLGEDHDEDAPGDEVYDHER